MKTASFLPTKTTITESERRALDATLRTLLPAERTSLALAILTTENSDYDLAATLIKAAEDLPSPTLFALSDAIADRAHEKSTALDRTNSVRVIASAI